MVFDMRVWIALLIVASCRSREATPTPVPSATASAQPPVASAETHDASPDASAPSVPCSEPKAIAQLQTVRDEAAAWNGDVIATRGQYLDPETLAATSWTKPPVATSNLLANGDRVVVRGKTLSAGSAWSQPLHKDERLDRIENGRWIVLETAETITNGTKEAQALRVIDGTTGKADPRKYLDVRGDMALAVHDQDVDVWNMATRKAALKDIPVCTAGGYWEWSLSSRFLVCSSNRAGNYLYDLRSGKEALQDQGSGMSPGETYWVRVPTVSWGGALISPDHVEWERIDTGRKVTLTKDVTPVAEDSPALSPAVPMAFCGDGKLFAIVDRHSLAVYRGADAARLAKAPAMSGGVIEFSASGRYLLHKRAGAATVFRLER